MSKKCLKIDIKKAPLMEAQAIDTIYSGEIRLTLSGQF